jgi:hypothetical protein
MEAFAKQVIQQSRKNTISNKIYGSTCHSQQQGQKWTHYYFGSFSLFFLAVFCGFLAEYQLEHKMKRTGKSFSKGILNEDIKKDTAAFQYQWDRFQ